MPFHHLLISQEFCIDIRAIRCKTDTEKYKNANLQGLKFKNINQTARWRVFCGVSHCWLWVCKRYFSPLNLGEKWNFLYFHRTDNFFDFPFTSFTLSFFKKRWSYHEIYKGKNFFSVERSHSVKRGKMFMTQLSLLQMLPILLVEMGTRVREAKSLRTFYIAYQLLLRSKCFHLRVDHPFSKVALRTIKQTRSNESPLWKG